jgi:multiple sugar transport system permease protein
MSVRSESLIAARPARRALSVAGWLDREDVFSWLMMALPLLFLVALVGYPLVYGVLLSLEDRVIGKPGHFVGLKNFITNFHDPIFWRVTVNTFVYTIAATILKMIGGLGLALAMNQTFRMKKLVRAVLLLPFIVPTVLGNARLAMVSVIMINTWRGLPFYGITLLAGLQTIPPELYEAATIDGGNGWQRFRYVTLPLLKPVILIVTLFSVIFTFADFQLVYVLTHGGPNNATNLFATYAFDIGMTTGQLGLGAAVALTMLPALALLIVALTLYIRKP